MQNPINKLLRSFIDFDLGKMFHRPDLPLAYRIVNWIVLLFTLAWPILFFFTLFLFDSPANESKAKPLVNLLQDQYEIPLFEPPTQGSLVAINSLYQSKYGLFTCLDS
jgi:hypothetical protein